MLRQTGAVFNRQSVLGAGILSLTGGALVAAPCGSVKLSLLLSGLSSHSPSARAMAASATGAMSAYPRSLGCKPSSE